MKSSRDSIRFLYLPGLGDYYDGFRRFALIFWKMHGVSTELVPMRWAHEASFQAKYNRALTAIERATEKGQRVVLVGESAGGSMALNLLADIPNVAAVITICGVNSPDIHIAPSLQRRNPAFVESVSRLSQSLVKINSSKIVTLYSAHDPSVARRFTILDNVQHQQLPYPGHIFAIAMSITFKSQTIVKTILNILAK